jgi:ribosome-binding protein aMBF1 (putative translation factor)
METNNHQIVDYSAVLEAQYGALGTPERAKFDEEAYAFYTSQILLDARKNARLTQEELAKRIGANKSYISRIEWHYSSECCYFLSYHKCFRIND